MGKNSCQAGYVQVIPFHCYLDTEKAFLPKLVLATALPNFVPKGGSTLTTFNLIVSVPASISQGTVEERTYEPQLSASSKYFQMFP